MRRKGKRKQSLVLRPMRETLGAPNERWSLHCVSDTLSNGRNFRYLGVVDEFCREALAVHVAHSNAAASVIEVLEQLRENRSLPAGIITHNASEFTSRAIDAWAYARGVRIDHIQPGKPVQNGSVESFNGTVGDEYLICTGSLHAGRAREDRELAGGRQPGAAPQRARQSHPEKYMGQQTVSEAYLATSTWRSAVAGLDPGSLRSSL